MLQRALATLLAALLVVGCGNGDGRVAGAGARSTLVIAFQSAPDTLDPVRHQSARSGLLWSTWLGAPLLVGDAGGDLRPRLAADMPARSDDALTWTMREARWSDGTAVTAEDVVATWKAMQSCEAALGKARSSTVGVAGIDVVSERTFRVRYGEGGPPPVAVEAFGRGFPVLRRGTSLEEPDEEAEGLGPYRVTSRSASEITLERRRPWWGDVAFPDEFDFDRLRLRFIPDESSIARSLAEGVVDIAGLSPGRAGEVAEREGVDVTTFYLPSFSYIGWNTTRPPFDDARVRRALSRLVPRDRLRRERFDDAVRPCDGPFDDRSEHDAVGYDPERAVRELGEAGWRDTDDDGFVDRGGERLTVEVLVPSGAIDWIDGVVTAWKDELAQAGVALTLQRLAVKPLVARLRARDYGATMLVRRVDEVRPTYRDMLHSSETKGAGRNFQGYESAAMDACIEAVSAAGDAKSLGRARRALRAHVLEERPITTLFHHASFLAWRPERVKPFVGARGLVWSRLARP